MADAVVVDVVRTPSGRGKPGGQLSHLHPVSLLAHVLHALVERNGLDPVVIEDVIAGCVTQSGEQSLNIARNAVLAAGLPESIPGTTVDRQCGSSQQAMHFAAQGVLAGAYDIVIACGVESMSRAPMFSNTQGRDAYGPEIVQRFPGGLIPQGISAELLAVKHGIDRDELDRFAAESHRRAAETAASGRFAGEIVAVPGADGATCDADETIRPTTTVAALHDLKPAFYDSAVADRFPEIEWLVTPGNSSPLTDGGSAALIMSETAAARWGLRPRARFHAFAAVGSSPMMMLDGVLPATRRVLDRGGLHLDEIDAYEVNEAFATVPLLWAKELGADAERLNPRGGAIALGHPLGASGTRLLTTLLNELETSNGRYGLMTMCEGGGMANATVIERL